MERGIDSRSLIRDRGHPLIICAVDFNKCVLAEPDLMTMSSVWVVTSNASTVRVPSHFVATMALFSVLEMYTSSTRSIKQVSPSTGTLSPVALSVYTEFVFVVSWRGRLANCSDVPYEFVNLYVSPDELIEALLNEESERVLCHEVHVRHEALKLAESVNFV